jgi:hypothetical protein
VLEEMSEASASGTLIARADLVADADGVDGRVMIFGDEHAQAVIKGRIGKFDLGHAGRSRLGKSRAGQSERT